MSPRAECLPGHSALVQNVPPGHFTLVQNVPPTPNPSGWPLQYNCMRVRKRALWCEIYLLYRHVKFVAVVQCE